MPVRPRPGPVPEAMRTTGQRGFSSSTSPCELYKCLIKDRYRGLSSLADKALLLSQGTAYEVALFILMPEPKDYISAEAESRHAISVASSGRIRRRRRIPEAC